MTKNLKRQLKRIESKRNLLAAYKRIHANWINGAKVSVNFIQVKLPIC